MALKYGKVVGQWRASVADTDADQDVKPDQKYLSGTVTLTPNRPWVHVTDSGDEYDLTLQPITCVLDDEGQLCLKEGDTLTQGVFLNFPGDPAFSLDTPYTVKATFRLALDGKPVERNGFSFELPEYDESDEDTIVDLTAAAPVAANGGTPIVRGPEGPPGPVTNGDLGQAVSVNLADGADYSITTAQVGGTLTLTLGGDVTISVPTPASTVSGTVSLVLVQDATGSRTVTWDSSILWPYGVAPTLSTDPGAADLIHLFWTGQDWVGLVGGSNLQVAS